jgi:hypothetical protein
VWSGQGSCGRGAGAGAGGGDEMRALEAKVEGRLDGSSAAAVGAGGGGGWVGFWGREPAAAAKGFAGAEKGFAVVAKGFVWLCDAVPGGAPKRAPPRLRGGCG